MNRYQIIKELLEAKMEPKERNQLFHDALKRLPDYDLNTLKIEWSEYLPEQVVK